MWNHVKPAKSCSDSRQRLTRPGVHSKSTFLGLLEWDAVAARLCRGCWWGQLESIVCVWQWTFEGWTGQQFCMSIILYIFRCFVISWRFPLLPATKLETHMRSRRVCAASIGCLQRGKQQPYSECLSYPSGHAMPPHDQHGFVWNYMKLWYPHKFDA